MKSKSIDEILEGYNKKNQLQIIASAKEFKTAAEKREAAKDLERYNRELAVISLLPERMQADARALLNQRIQNDKKSRDAEREKFKTQHERDIDQAVSRLKQAATDGLEEQALERVIKPI